MKNCVEIFKRMSREEKKTKHTRKLIHIDNLMDNVDFKE